METIEIQTFKYYRHVKNCFSGLEEKGRGSVDQLADGRLLRVRGPYSMLLPQNVSESAMAVILEKNGSLRGLRETRKVLLRFMPAYVKIEIQKMAKDFLQENKVMNLEGFVSFRLKSYGEIMNGLVRDYLKEYTVQMRYFSLLDMIRDCINTEGGKGDLHIFRERFNNAGDMLEAVIDYLPQRVIIHGGEGYPDKNAISCLRYIYGNKLVLWEYKA